MKILLFGELVSSNNFLFFLLEKLHLINIFTNLGTYLQGIPTQNTTDFIWGTDSGIRSLPVSFYLFLLQFFVSTNWYWVYISLIIILPIICFCLALRIYKKLDVFVLLGALFYAGNTWIINRLLSGYWQLNLVYAFLPFLITIPLAFTNKTSYTCKSLLFWSTIFALLSSIVITSQPHFLLMVSFFLLIHLIFLLFSRKNNKAKMLLLLYGAASLEFFLINIYFFVPSQLFPEKLFTAPNQYFSIGSVIFNGQGSTLFHVFQLSPVAYPFIAHQTDFVERVQFLQLAFIAFFFIIRKKREWLFLFSTIVFLFLAKGLNPPLVQISNFLYTYIPVLHYFRDPTRFIGAVALFGSFIIGVYTTKRKLPVFLTSFLIFVFLSVLLIANWRVISTIFSSTLAETNIPEQYVSMQKYINSISSNNRLFILPNKGGYVGYSFYHNDPLPPSDTLYDMVLPVSLPLADSSNYPDNYSNQMSALIYDRFTESYNTNLLQILGVGYILTDSSITQPINEYTIATSSPKILQKLPDIQLKENIKNLNLFAYTKKTALVTTEKPIFAIGNLQTILHVHEQGITRPVILLNQSVNTNTLNNSLLHGQDIFIDDSQPLITLSAEELAGKYNIDILQTAWNYDKSLVNCEPSKMAYIVPAGNLFTSGRCVESGFTTGIVTMPTHIQKGTYKVLLKAMDVGTPSTIALSINNTAVRKKIMTGQKLQWIDLGIQTVTTNNDNVNISILDRNKIVIDYLLFVPINKWNVTVRKNKQVISRMNPVTLQEIQVSQENKGNGVVNINKISTAKTKYLTYRFSWGKWWTSDKPSISFISDGYAMTFIATNDKISYITYFPDIVYSICIALSIFVVVSLIAYIIWCSLNFRKTSVKKSKIWFERGKMVK